MLDHIWKTQSGCSQMIVRSIRSITTIWITKYPCTLDLIWRIQSSCNQMTVKSLNFILNLLMLKIKQNKEMKSTMISKATLIQRTQPGWLITAMFSSVPPNLHRTRLLIQMVSENKASIATIILSAFPANAFHGCTKVPPACLSERAIPSAFRQRIFRKNYILIFISLSFP